jgi:hypothetical protein
MPGQVNPDGTVQVSPPLASAFGPASASAPPPPMQAQPGVQPTSPQADPGFAGAIMSLLHQLMQFAPKSVTQAKARTDQNVSDQGG